ncbi:MAG: hypothetical protein ACI9KE_006354 [Polyangiales bacterium]
MERAAEERLRLAGQSQVVLRALWEECARVGPRETPPSPTVRLAAEVEEHLDADIDSLIEPLLTRWASAYIDVGQAGWQMPNREEGFFLCTLELLDTWVTRFGFGGVWLRREAQRLRIARVGSFASVVESLEAIGVGLEETEAFVFDTLMRMPGFAGMFERLDKRPDLAPTSVVPPAKLIDFLAVRLLLERAATRTLLMNCGALCESKTLLGSVRELRVPITDAHADFRKAAPIYHVALTLGITPSAMGQATALEIETLRQLTEDTLGNEARWLWHLAYERRYRVDVLDSLSLHTPDSAPSPHTQLTMCIDDREESFRRHLEEVDGGYETFGYAGFYNIAIRFQALGQQTSRALCPASVTPTHAMIELPLESGPRTQPRAPLISRGAQSGLLRGALENLFGWVALPSVAYRLLFPEKSARRRRRRRAPATQLSLCRAEDDTTTKFGLPLGFTEAEMAVLVGDALEQMGLARVFAPLVVVLGHHSHNVNNPHEAGYNCGACAGGSGAPNARAFAAMANRPGVRDRLRKREIAIPDGTHFLGGVHETAGDVVTFFDLEAVPASHLERVARLRTDIEEAARRDAHERCRRFMSASLDMDEAAALEHVIGRTEDLAQARPEYNHVANALCVVGRRAMTRGLFLDRRAFLVSYDPVDDRDGEGVGRLLASVGPVGAGINLEYFFSFVDNEHYGAGTKLPHNVVGLLSVMNGSASDLRTGLVEQMVEIHEPMRLLLVVEAKPEVLTASLAAHPGLSALVTNRWVLVATVDPRDRAVHFLESTGFEPHVPSGRPLRSVARSRDAYQGRRDALRPARVSLNQKAER